METTRVFINGRSQAVRIPKAYRFDTDEVFINKVGKTVLLTAEKDLAAAFDEGIRLLTDDFMADGRPEQRPSERTEL